MIAMAEPLRKSAKPAEETSLLPLDSVSSHKIFPGRTSLYVHEVARALHISVPQVISLINEGLLVAVEVTGRGNKTSREHWRVPVSALDAYVEARRSDKKTGGKR